MAQYRVLATSYIGERIVEAGEVIDYEGLAGSNLEAVSPKDAKASEAKARAALRAEALRLNAQVEVKGEGGAPSAFRPVTDEDSDEAVGAAIAAVRLSRAE